MCLANSIDFVQVFSVDFFASKQTASPSFRGDGREVRKYSRNGIKDLMQYCIFIQSQHACLEHKRGR